MAQAFTDYKVVANTIRHSVTTLAQLLALREENSVFEEVVDKYVFDVWVRVLTTQNIKNAFQRKLYGIIEKILMARDYYRAHKAEFGDLEPDVDKMKYKKTFIENRNDRQLDELFIAHGFLDLTPRGTTMTALAYSCSESPLWQRAIFLLEKGADPDRKGVSFISKPFYVFLQLWTGSDNSTGMQLFQAFLKRGVDLDQKFQTFHADFKNQGTYLNEMFYLEFFPIADRLMDAGASIDAAGIKYILALKNDELYDSLRRRWFDWSPQQYENWLISFMRRILRASIDLKQFAFDVYEGKTLRIYLEAAAEQGVDVVNIQNANGDTPLIEDVRKIATHRVAVNPNRMQPKEISTIIQRIRVWLNYGADPTLTNSQGESAFTLVAQNAEMVGFLNENIGERKATQLRQEKFIPAKTSGYTQAFLREQLDKMEEPIFIPTVPSERAFPHGLSLEALTDMARVLHLPSHSTYPTMYHLRRAMIEFRDNVLIPEIKAARAFNHPAVASQASVPVINSVEDALAEGNNPRVPSEQIFKFGGDQNLAIAKRLGYLGLYSAAAGKTVESKKAYFIAYRNSQLAGSQPAES